MGFMDGFREFGKKVATFLLGPEDTHSTRSVNYRNFSVVITGRPQQDGENGMTIISLENSDRSVGFHHTTEAVIQLFMVIRDQQEFPITSDGTCMRAWGKFDTVVKCVTGAAKAKGISASSIRVVEPPSPQSHDALRDDSLQRWVPDDLEFGVERSGSNALVNGAARKESRRAAKNRHEEPSVEGVITALKTRKGEKLPGVVVENVEGALRQAVARGANPREVLDDPSSSGLHKPAHVKAVRTAIDQVYRGGRSA